MRIGCEFVSLAAFRNSVKKVNPFSLKSLSNTMRAEGGGHGGLAVASVIALELSAVPPSARVQTIC